MKTTGFSIHRYIWSYFKGLLCVYDVHMDIEILILTFQGNNFQGILFTVQLNCNIWPDLHSSFVLMLLQVFLQAVLVTCVFGEVIFVCLCFVSCGC